MKKNIFAAIALTTMITLVFTICVNTEAKVRASKKNLTIEVSKTYTIKLKGVKGKIIWKSSKPWVVKVNKKGKITALRKGRATITAKAGKKSYKCVVTVEDKKNTGALDMAAPTPDNPAAIQENPTATAGQPTSTPEPTPVPTPDNPDSELCVPGVLEFAAYMDCRISDIGESYVEISGADGEIICRFVEHSPSSGLQSPEYYLDPDLEVVYDGILTDSTGTPFTSYTEFRNYTAKGDNMNYSDIRIGDIVDVVYYHDLNPEVEKRVNFCVAINVHKR